MIELKNINKTFKVAKRNAGFSEAVKALFKKEYTYINALQDVSFTIGDGEKIKKDVRTRILNALISADRIDGVFLTRICNDYGRQ